MPKRLFLALLFAIPSCKSLTDRQVSVATISTDSALRNNAGNPRKYNRNESDPLFAFVGEKIEVKSFPDKNNSFDSRFKATYKVLQKVFGDFRFDTIEFVAYDHYGIPDFSKYKNLLLFVSEDSGAYYHQKYLFYDVYKTKAGRWAGCYSKYDYDRKNNIRSKTKPVKIDFADRVSYPTKLRDENGNLLSRSFPTPYFETIGDSAFAVYGNYVDELFALERDGVLTARKIFFNGKLKK